MDSLYVLVAAGAMAAGFVQGLSGFGFGMVAMSFWAWTIDPKLAAAMVVFGSLTGQLLAAFTVRRGFTVAHLLPFVAGGLLGIPVGVKLLPYLDPLMFKALVGGLLAIWCPIMLFATPASHYRRRTVRGWRGGRDGRRHGRHRRIHGRYPDLVVHLAPLRP